MVCISSKPASLQPPRRRRSLRLRRQWRRIEVRRRPCRVLRCRVQRWRCWLSHRCPWRGSSHSRGRRRWGPGRRASCRVCGPRGHPSWGFGWDGFWGSRRTRPRGGPGRCLWRRRWLHLRGRRCRCSTGGCRPRSGGSWRLLPRRGAPVRWGGYRAFGLARWGPGRDGRGACCSYPWSCLKNPPSPYVNERKYEGRLSSVGFKEDEGFCNFNLFLRFHLYLFI